MFSAGDGDGDAGFNYYITKSARVASGHLEQTLPPPPPPPPAAAAAAAAAPTFDAIMQTHWLIQAKQTCEQPESNR